MAEPSKARSLCYGCHHTGSLTLVSTFLLLGSRFECSEIIMGSPQHFDRKRDPKIRIVDRASFAEDCFHSFFWPWPILEWSIQRNHCLVIIFKETHRSLPGHHKPYALFNRLRMRVLRIYESQHCPTSLKNLRVFVLDPFVLLTRLRKKGRNPG